MTLKQDILRTLDSLTARGVTLPADIMSWKLSTTEQFSEDFVDVPDGVIVAFYPDPAIAKALAVDGGEPPEDIHITLALPGKLSELSLEQRRRLPVIIRGFAMISRPLSGTISGLTEFPIHESKKPIVYLLDVPGLPAWRQRLVEILVLNGYKVSNDHGFVPHMTIKYADPKEGIKTEPPKTVLTFDNVYLTMGGKRKEYALGGNPEVDEGLDAFADKRGAGKPGGRTKEVTAVNDYQKALEDAYAKWAREMARDLANAKPEDRNDILEAALAALLAILIALGHEYLPDAVDLGLDGTAPFADIYGELEDAMDENDAYLRDSLIPAIREKVRRGLYDDDILLALATGAGAVALFGLLDTVTSRVALYAGAFWGLLNKIRGMAADETGQKVVAYLDPRASHCSECPEFADEGGREYASYEEYLQITGGRTPGQFECGSGCRCWLEFGQN